MERHCVHSDGLIPSTTGHCVCKYFCPNGFNVDKGGWSDAFLWLKIGFWIRLWNPQWMKILVALYYVHTQLCLVIGKHCLHVDILCIGWVPYCFGIVLMVAQCLKLQKSLHTNLLGNDEVELHPLQLFRVHTTWRWWSWLQYDRRVDKTITEILLDMDNTVGRRVLISDLFRFASQHMCALVLSALLRSFSTCTMLCFLREDQNKAPWLLLIPLSAMFKAPKRCRVMYSLMDRVAKTITEVLPDVDNTVRRGVLISGFFPFKS